MKFESHLPGLIILDRDGTLIEQVHHLTKLSEVKLMPDVGHSLAKLKNCGFRFAIVTNQSVIGRGLTTRENVDRINKYIESEFQDVGVTFESIKVCPHTPWSNCICRKPNPYLGQEIMVECNVKPSKVWMIGDQVTDLQFGQNLGVKTCLINSNNPENPLGVPNFASWPELTSHILKAETSNR
jgi:D-glycero-D-manno-heptose 1,7-bisphosphate phosphatase